jgi:hypothetical protein
LDWIPRDIHGIIGKYFSKKREIPLPQNAPDVASARRPWQVSEEMIKLGKPYNHAHAELARGVKRFRG